MDDARQIPKLSQDELKAYLESPESIFGRPEGQLGFRSGEFDGLMVLAHNGRTDRWEVLAFTKDEDEARRVTSEYEAREGHYDNNSHGVVTVNAALKGSGMLGRLPWPKASAGGASPDPAGSEQSGEPIPSASAASPAA